MKSKSVGTKIKFLRNRARLSQLNLELQIQAAQGSISRIEKDDVNPTKETLLKIIQVLELPIHESIDLLGLNMDNILNLFSVLNKLSSSVNINNVLQKSLTYLSDELKLLSSSVFLINDANIPAKFLLDSIPLPSNFLFPTEEINNIFDIKDKINEKNIFCRVYQNRKSINSNDISKLIYPFTSATTEKNILRSTPAKSVSIWPILIGRNVFGMSIFFKDYDDNFEIEYPILKAFNKHLGFAIENSKKYQYLKERVRSLEHNSKNNKHLSTNIINITNTSKTYKIKENKAFIVKDEIISNTLDLLNFAYE